MTFACTNFVITGLEITNFVNFVITKFANFVIINFVNLVISITNVVNFVITNFVIANQVIVSLH